VDWGCSAAEVSLLTSAATKPNRLAIIGAGIVSTAGSTLAEVHTAFRQGGATPSFLDVPVAQPAAKARVYACGEFGAEQLFDPAKRRRLSRLQQMALAAARRALPADAASSVAPGRICVAMSTGLGSLNDTAAFVENMILKDERVPRPAFFTNSVHNSLASQVAIELSLRGLNSTPLHREISFETALWHSANEVAQGRADLALVGAADELNQYPLAAGLRWGWWNEQSPQIKPFSNELGGSARALPGEGCAVFTLAPADQVTKPLAWVSGIRFGLCATQAGGRIDAAAEAQWIRETVERDGGSLQSIDLLLTGANGWEQLDRVYLEITEELARLAGRRIHCGAYKQCCGEHHSASAFGFLTAIGLVRGEIPVATCVRDDSSTPPSDQPCRNVVLYTLSPTGNKGMACVCA